MLYDLKQGAREDELIQAAKLGGLPIPPAIANKPVLLPGLQFVYSAFWMLSSDRQYGMAEGPIPWSAIDRFAMRHGIWDDEFDRFCTLIRKVDGVYLDYRGKQNKKELSKASKGKSSLKTNLKA